MKTSLGAAVLAATMWASAQATCDPATDETCATVRFFKSDDTDCAGEVQKTATALLHPANFDNGAALCVALASGEIDLQVQVCYDDNCDAMVNVRSAVGECVAVQLPGASSGVARAKVDADCRAVGVCAIGEDDCLVLDAVESCSGGPQTNPAATYGRVADGKCYRTVAGKHFSAECGEDGAINVRESCNADCSVCDYVALGLEKDVCTDIGKGIIFVPRNTCATETPGPTASPTTASTTPTTPTAPSTASALSTPAALALLSAAAVSTLAAA